VYLFRDIEIRFNICYLLLFGLLDHKGLLFTGEIFLYIDFGTKSSPKNKTLKFYVGYLEFLYIVAHR
jgi:hypothetical protein